jgi:hypothetical protein
MELMSWDNLSGVIVDYNVNDGGLEIITTDGVWQWTAEGDCCAHAYIHEPTTVAEELKALIDQRIVSSDVDGGNREDDGSYGEVRDITFYKIQCEKGSITITLYVDHNGYYGGSLSGGKLDASDHSF